MIAKNMGIQRFENKVVIVTGAASGIGAAICEKFGQEGSKIGLLDRDKAGVRDAAERLQSVGVE